MTVSVKLRRSEVVQPQGRVRAGRAYDVRRPGSTGHVRFLRIAAAARNQRCMRSERQKGPALPTSDRSKCCGLLEWPLR